MKRKYFYIFSFLALSALLISCDKDLPPSVLKPGIYEYVSITGYNYSSIEDLHEQPKVRFVSKANWKTSNVSGELVVDDKSISTAGLAFSLDTSALNETYTNGTLTKTGIHTHSITINPYNSKHNFISLAGDSLKFVGGTTLFDGAISTNEPVILKVKTEDGYLTISTHYYKKEIKSNDISSWETVIEFSLTARLKRKP